MYVCYTNKWLNIHHFLTYFARKLLVTFSRHVCTFHTYDARSNSHNLDTHIYTIHIHINIYMYIPYLLSTSARTASNPFPPSCLRLYFYLNCLLFHCARLSAHNAGWFEPRIGTHRWRVTYAGGSEKPLVLQPIGTATFTFRFQEIEGGGGGGVIL